MKDSILYRSILVWLSLNLLHNAFLGQRLKSSIIVLVLDMRFPYREDRSLSACVAGKGHPTAEAKANPLPLPHLPTNRPPSAPKSYPRLGRTRQPISSPGSKTRFSYDFDKRGASLPPFSLLHLFRGLCFRQAQPIGSKETSCARKHGRRQRR